MWVPLIPLLVHASIGNASDPVGDSTTSATRRPVRAASAAPHSRHFGVEADAQIADLGADRLPRGSQVSTISGTNNSAGGAANATAAPRGAFAELNLAAATSKVAHHHGKDTSKVNHIDHAAAPKPVQGTFAELEQHAGKAHAAMKATARMYYNLNGVKVPVSHDFLLPYQVHDLSPEDLVALANRLGVYPDLIDAFVRIHNPGGGAPSEQEEDQNMLTNTWNAIGGAAQGFGDWFGDRTGYDAKKALVVAILRAQVDEQENSRNFDAGVKKTLTKDHIDPILLHGRAYHNKAIASITGENTNSWFILDAASQAELAPFVEGADGFPHMAVIRYWETGTLIGGAIDAVSNVGSDCNGLVPGISQGVGLANEITYMGVNVDPEWATENGYNDYKRTAITVDQIEVLPVNIKAPRSRT